MGLRWKWRGKWITVRNVVDVVELGGSVGYGCGGACDVLVVSA